MKSYKKFLPWIVVAIILILLAIPKLNFGDKSSNAMAFQSRDPIPVSVKVMQHEVLDNKIISTGTIFGKEEIELRSETSGKVTKINFDEGGNVKKGQLLVKINDAELQAQLSKSKTQLNLAEEKEFRQRKLLEKGLTSQSIYDDLLNSVNTIKADIAYLQAQIEKTEIIAPFNGVVGLRNISVGSYISPAVVIANFQKIDSVKIDFSIPQKYSSELREGKKINFSLPSIAEIFSGYIYAIEPKIDISTRTLRARAIAANKSKKLLPGSFAEIEILLSQSNDALMVPTESIVPDITGEKVFLYRNGKAFPQIVRTGIRTEKNIQILEGLAPGDSVITSGIIQLRPGIEVIIQN